MALHIDTAWCPGCDRHIVPKRYTVSMTSPSQPVAPPTSPKQPVQEPSTARRTKGRVSPLRQKSGLVQGTGRLKPNGTIKSETSLDQPVAKTSTPTKTRTVIDQGPVPLYCSDECQIKDLSISCGALDIDFNPARNSPPPPPAVPHNSYSSTVCGSYSSSAVSSDESSSCSQISSSDNASPTSELAGMSASMATLFQLYNWKVPPPAPLSCTDTSPTDTSNNALSGGIIMTGRRITAAFRPSPKPKHAFDYSGSTSTQESRTAIPGWTDGSNAWRGEVYNLAPPSCSQQVPASRSLSSPILSVHRSHDSHSAMAQPIPISSAAASLPTRTPEGLSTEELYSKYSQSFSRRSESRASLYPSFSAPRSYPVMPTAPRRERSLVHPDAAGKLLVPDVKLKVRGGSSASLASSSPTSVRSSSDDGMSATEGKAAPSSPALRRPVPLSRSSTDSLYDMMPLPPQKETRIEKHVVNGVEKNVLVEIEVVPLKRLFRFAGDESPRPRQRVLPRT